MDSFLMADREAYLSDISAKNIVESLTIDDVKRFLESLGVDQLEISIERGYICCPTICHHPLHEHASMKLYWYQDHKIFRCFTECNEAMSIFELYRRYMSLNYYDVTFEDAKLYIKNFLQNINVQIKRTSNFEEIKNKYQFKNHIPPFPVYSETVLDCFSHYYHPTWLKDGIKKEVMDKFGIRFSLSQNKIIIPHRDITGALVGIRGRALNEDEIQNGEKYKPIQIGNILYTYKLQYNLYGIYEHQNGIKRRKSAIIAEAEKSVMLDEGYYGELSNCVACCGSSFNKYQISLLTDILGANEIIIALDKEYTDWRTDKAKAYRKKIEDACKPYLNQATFSYIWDYNNLLEEKDSPFDKGKEIFEKLFKERVRIR